MRYNDEILGLQKSSKYKYAKKIFDSLLNREIPDNTVLKKLYKESYQKILEFCEKFIEEDYGEKRIHDDDAPTLINDARLSVAKNKNFQNIHNELLKFKVPDVIYLKKFFGEYDVTVLHSYKLFIESKKVRKSGISMTCHHNRVACTFFELNKDNPEVKRYSSVAALHDFIEDLMYSLNDSQGNRYSIENYQEFLDKLIPKDLQEPVKLLTNHYDMILKYADYHLERRGKRFNKENVLEFLKLLDYNAYNELKEFIIKTINIIESSPYEETSSKDYLEDIKWKCYIGLYIPEIVNISYHDKTHLVLLVKLIDLSDNNHGLDSMDQSSKIKNIRKSVITADLIATLDTDKLFFSYIREIREDALVKAEYFVLKDMMHQESCQDFFVDALVKIQKMKDVFYTKKHLKNSQNS